MKKVLASLLMVSLSLVLVACGNNQQGTITATVTTSVTETISVTESPLPTRRSDFSLIFRYGFGEVKNELNTTNGTYTKDMISAASLTVKLALSPDELDGIYEKMQEIDFFDYPSDFSIKLPQGSTTLVVTPSEKYYFKVTNGPQIKELSWDDKIRNEDIQASKLRELIQLIKNIIASKDEYKTLPPASGGYM